MISREDAFKQGLDRFFTGVPCKRGHNAQRYVSTGQCVQCMAMRNHRFSNSNRTVERHFQDIGLQLVSFWLHPDDIAAVAPIAEALKEDRLKAYDQQSAAAMREKFTTQFGHPYTGPVPATAKPDDYRHWYKDGVIPEIGDPKQGYRPADASEKANPALIPSEADRYPSERTYDPMTDPYVPPPGIPFGSDAK